MGMIRISVQGSFRPNEEKVFSAIKHGHAAAVADAIRWLSGTLLQRAIRSDHNLHENGHKPDGPFGNIEDQ